MPTPAETILRKAILPTTKTSAQIRETVPAEIRRRSFFSARTAQAEYLAKIRQVCADVAAGRIGQGEARFRMEAFLDEIGYEGAGAPGSVTDIGSIERLNLIIDTQRDMAHSAALLDAQTDVTLAMFPAWRLVRFGTRKDPRNWPLRWEQAAGAVAGQGVATNGEMVARKDSPIWAALGSGAGGYRDTLGNPYPPFAFNSGMDWEAVSADECKEIGLDISDLRAPRGPSLDPDEADKRRAALKIGPGELDRILADLED